MPAPSGPVVATQPCGPGLPSGSLPSVSVKEILQVGESKVSWPAKTRPVIESTKPIGSEFTNCEVGAWLEYQLTLEPSGQLSLNFAKTVCRSDWNAVMPFTGSCGDCQLMPIEGSPASRPRYST